MLLSMNITHFVLPLTGQTTARDRSKPPSRLTAATLLLPLGFAPNTARMHLDRTTLTRWTLACESLREHGAAWIKYKILASQAAVCDDKRYVMYKYRPQRSGQADFVAAAVPNWPNRHLTLSPS